MLTVNIEADNIRDYFEQVKEVLGGDLSENGVEYILNLDNSNAKGTLRYCHFDWGASIFDYDITFFQEVQFIINSSQYNPIFFAYCLEGHCWQRFAYEDKERKIEQYQSAIISGANDSFKYGRMPANVPLKINSIRVDRARFMQSRFGMVKTLNQRMHDVFLDEVGTKSFSYLGSYNLVLAPLVEKLYTMEAEGFIRVMKIEGLIFQILSAHLMDHESSLTNKNDGSSLLNRDLHVIREMAHQISAKVSEDYSLPTMSCHTGLSQVKLQEGFKKLYGRTVTDYVRHVRLETARNLLRQSDMNVSEVVYSVGFNNRSYFSEIFKKQYGMSPSEFKRKLRRTGSD